MFSDERKSMRHLSMTTAVLAIVLAFVITPAFAETYTVDAGYIESRIQALERWKERTEDIHQINRKSKDDLPLLTWGVNALQFRYQNFLNRDISVGKSSNFLDIHRGEFLFYGSLGDFGPFHIKKWQITTNFASQTFKRPTSRTDEPAQPTNTEILREAFIDFTPTGFLKPVEDYVSMARVGMYRIPFGISAETSAGLIDFINLPYFTSGPVEFIQERDMFFMLRGYPFQGTKKFVEYSAVVMNGNGQNGLSAVDNNAQKDFIGRLRYHPFPGLFVSASSMFGHSTSINTNITGRGDGSYDRWGLDFRWSPGSDQKFSSSPKADHDGLWLQGEYIMGHDAPGAVSKGATSVTGFLDTPGARRETAYIYALYKLNDQWEPVIRWEFFDPDTKTPNDLLTRTTVGFNYYLRNAPKRIQVKLQANYEFRNRDGLLGAAKKTDPFNNDMFTLQFQLRWL